MQERFNLEYLNTFVIAAETKKFNVTAEMVYRSHSSVSTQIKKLEEQVGEPLFIREKDTLTLTQAGETLYKYAQQILELNDSAFNSLNNADWQGALTLGVPTDYVAFLVKKVYPTIKQEFNDYNFDIVASRSRILRKQMAEGKVDISLVAMEPQYSDDYPLWEEKMFWVASHDLTLDASQSLPVALFSDNCIVNNYSLRCLKKTDANFKVVFKSTMMDNIASAVQAGVAVSLLPESLITTDMRILSTDLIDCPFKLKVGLTSKDQTHRDIVQRLGQLIRSKVSLATIPA